MMWHDMTYDSLNKVYSFYVAFHHLLRIVQLKKESAVPWYRARMEGGLLEGGRRFA